MACVAQRKQKRRGLQTGRREPWTGADGEAGTAQRRAGGAIASVPHVSGSNGTSWGQPRADLRVTWFTCSSIATLRDETGPCYTLVEVA